MQHSRTPLFALLAAATLPGLALGDDDPKKWVDLLSISPPVHKGTPAELVLDEAQSNDQSTTFELLIYGYWTEQVTGPDGLSYERLTFPGLGAFDQVGAPELPAYRTKLVTPLGANEIFYGGEQVAQQDLFIDKLRLVPQPVRELDLDPAGPEGDGDGDPDGTSSSWAKDDGLYATDALFPAQSASQLVLVDDQIGGAKCGEIELFPVRYNPAQESLEIQARTRYTFRHPGSTDFVAPMTKDAFALAGTECVNGSSMGPWFGADTTTYKGRYLIVTPSLFEFWLEPFVDHRKSMGYLVTVVTTESLPSTECFWVRQAIRDWYAAGDPSYDHYCLLVGDDWAIPTCQVGVAGSTVYTDDYYGSMFADLDLDEEVYVGRWPVDTIADVVLLRNKTMAYELDTNPLHDYGNTLLVADEEEAPDKYVGAQETVRTASYEVQPNFQTAYGHLPGVDETEVIDAIEDDLGIVCYRGHGSSSNWSTWSQSGGDLGSFHKSEVGDLENDQLPVVWSFSCTNNKIHDTDGIGEHWVLSPNSGVSHYGASKVSGTLQNHLLDQFMFHGVFNLGLTTQGQAIAYAEYAMRLFYPDGQNAWAYSLLGCPAMKIRTGPTQTVLTDLPDTLVGEDHGQGVVPLTVQDASGAPLAGALVCLFQKAFGPDGAEFQVNRYTDENGRAFLPAPSQLGDLKVVIRGASGGYFCDEVPVQIGDWIDLGDGLAGYAKQHPVLSSVSPLTPNTKLVLEIDGAAPQTVGLLGLAAKDIPVPLFGGTIHIVEALATFPVVTDPNGHFGLTLGPWPAGVPTGTELIFQAGLLDAEAPEGISLSNALKAVAP